MTTELSPDTLRRSVVDGATGAATKATIYPRRAGDALAAPSDLVFDIYENETHASTARVTEHPIEDGSVVTDHVVQQSDTLTLVAKISNTPVISSEEAALLNVGIAHVVDDAYRQLLSMKNAGQAIDVFTELRKYENMAILSVSITRDKSTGDALAVTLQLKQIRTAQSQVIFAPTPLSTGAAKNRGQPKADKGAQPTKDAPAPIAAKAQTIANDLLNTTAGNAGVTLPGG